MKRVRDRHRNPIGDADSTISDSGRSRRWGTHQESTTTERVRFSERTAVRMFSPVVPTLPEEDELDDRTVPDHGARLAFGHTVEASDIDLHAAEARLDLRPESAVPGSIIADRYRVVRAVGEGGMGKVFEVTHVRLGKTFALKVLHEHLAEDENFVRDFFREAKFASSLDHPNILSVVDFGEDRRYGAFMAMEYIEGEPLSELLAERQRLSVRRACDMVLQLAEALRYIHQHEIVHCDIKTRNILLCDDPSDKRRRGVVKLLDFGLARGVTQKAPERLFGTPEYLAPELAQRRQPTPRSDIYSLGILFFELLTGQVPFRGPVARILRAHLEEPMPSPSATLGSAVDPALEKLIYKACEKDPADRHKDMSAFLYELKTVMEMLGFHKPRRVAPVVSTGISTPLPDKRTEMLCAAFDAFRLPIATITATGEIVAANAAFARFVVGMMVKVEGMRIQDTLLARAWYALDDDLATACAGQSLGRVIEVASETGLMRLQMWLEPIGMPGYACFSVHPIDDPA